MTHPRSKIANLTQPARPQHPPLVALQNPIQCDVCVVGGGLTGLLTALLCAQSGLNVVVLERYRTGSGETSRSSGHVTEILDTGLQTLIKIHGREKLQHFTEAHRAAIHRLLQLTEQLLGPGGAGLTRVPGYLYTEHDHRVDALRRELELLSEFHISSNSQQHTPLPFPIIEAIRIENQAMLDPNLLVAALLQAALSEGVRVYEQSPVTKIDIPRPPHRSSVKLATPKASVAAEWCVLATHSPALDLHPVHFEMSARRTYLLSAKLKSSTLLGGVYWDMNGPYHYIRPDPQRSGPNVLIGGMDHAVGAPPLHEPELLLRLEDFARARFEIDEITHAWSGQILESADGLPYLGHSLRSEQILFASGYGGNGISLSMLAAGLLHEKIEGSNPELWSILSPLRLNNRKAWVALASNTLNYLERRTTPALRRAPALDPSQLTKTLAPGEACIAKYSEPAKPHQKTNKKTKDSWVALSRDESGSVHAVSARCTHLGAELHYNSLEKTWDCPCHGSRFSRDGKIICGPALSDLRKIPSLPEAAAEAKPKKEEAA
jgi:glycine/D-amino acid oxidase-like deaminating enzyme/nitrite reductase/ring-hydroxylating ferredoxin subunit